MSFKETLLTHKTELKYLYDFFISHLRNEENKIRIRDFKTVTTRINEASWLMSLYGPDNKPFEIKHPKLKFTSSTWNIKRKSNLVPWFICELPETLYLIVLSWYMRSIAYRSWTASSYSPYYADLLST